MAIYKRNYRNIFFAYNGPGPYPCFYCEEAVTFEEVLVHHLDENHNNDSPANLAASHTSCHHQHHGFVERIRNMGGSHLHSNNCRCPFCVPVSGDNHPGKTAEARANMSRSAKARVAREKEQKIGRWAA